jgi:molecular chaperone HtpG
MSVNPQTETLGFQAEVKQLLHLVTHSLYSNKEIFLRELISNASDAADRLRFEAISDLALYENDADLKIWIDFDEKNHTITVRDNGIGMNRDDVINNLGTIAKSGTREFLERLKTEDKNEANLIGQFGVGFYSSFVVADKVVVRTRRAGMKADQGVEWESDGAGEYSLKNIDKATRGTEIVLYLKEDERPEFLNGWRLREIIKKYSDHIMLPIVMKKDVYEDKSGDEKDQEKKAEKKTPEDEVVNRATALWTLPKSSIKDEDYKELYKHITHDFDEPLLWSHNQVEGKLEYITLLYIPTRAPFDLWHRDKRYGLKLYVQRVFIMDDAEQLLPEYLRFVRGIVDSKDLPLNVSREILQNNKVIESIRGGIVKRVLDMLEKLAQDDKEKYAKFWSAFGQVLKEGMVEDFANRERIAKLLRFASTYADTETQNVSLDEYISRMPQTQDKIYYITADAFNTAKNSPHLEIFRKKGVEVLLLSDRIDEWMLAHFTEYQGKKLQSVAKGEADLGGLEDKVEKEKQEQEKNAFESTIKQMKQVLGERVQDVRVTHRLTGSPACLVAGENDMSLHLHRIMQASGQAIPAGKPLLEVNPEHPLLLRLKSEPDDQRFADLTNVLFEQAILAEGGKLDDPANFVKRLNALLLQLSQ